MPLTSGDLCTFCFVVVLGCRTSGFNAGQMVLGMYDKLFWGCRTSCFGDVGQVGFECRTSGF